MESYNKRILEQLGIYVNFIQDNHSFQKMQESFEVYIIN